MKKRPVSWSPNWALSTMLGPALKDEARDVGDDARHVGAQERRRTIWRVMAGGTSANLAHDLA